MSHNINLDGDRTSWCQLRGEERMAREDARRSRELYELIHKQNEEQEESGIIHRVAIVCACGCGLEFQAQAGTSRFSPQCRRDRDAEASRIRNMEFRARQRTGQASTKKMGGVPALDVQAIRHLIRGRHVGAKLIARALELNPSAVKQMASGKTHRSVPEDEGEKVLERAKEILGKANSLRVDMKAVQQERRARENAAQGAES